MFSDMFQSKKSRWTEWTEWSLAFARPWRRKPHVPRPQLWRTILSSRRQIFRGVFVFFSIEGDGGPCWNGMLYYVETLPNKNLMSSCTCFFLLTVRSSDCRCFFWWESMCCPWSRGYQQGHWGPWRRVGEPTSNKGQCHGSNVYDQVRPHRSKEGCLLLFGSFLLFHPVFFFKFVCLFFLKVTWVACVFFVSKVSSK